MRIIGSLIRSYLLKNKYMARNSKMYVRSDVVFK